MERNGWAYSVQEPHAHSLGSSIIKGAGKRGTRVRPAAVEMVARVWQKRRGSGPDRPAVTPPRITVLPAPLNGRPHCQQVKQYGDNFSFQRRGVPIWPHPGFGNK